ncbi:MAG: hypothetical protein NTX52_06990 [Planctomycetota bacterium]|nr:hypothetical protein [Planctomycetota bacterium]
MRLNHLANRVVLRGESICGDRKICDYLVFVADGNIVIGVVELKGKTVHASEAIEKLANGTEIALQMFDQCTNNRPKFQIYPLVLAKSWDTSQYEVLTSRTFTVRGVKCRILPKRCGVSFSEVISSLR